MFYIFYSNKDIIIIAFASYEKKEIITSISKNNERKYLLQTVRCNLIKTGKLSLDGKHGHNNTRVFYCSIINRHNNYRSLVARLFHCL